MRIRGSTKVRSRRQFSAAENLLVLTMPNRQRVIYGADPAIVRRDHLYVVKLFPVPLLNHPVEG